MCGLSHTTCPPPHPQRANQACVWAEKLTLGEMLAGAIKERCDDDLILEGRKVTISRFIFPQPSWLTRARRVEEWEHVLQQTIWDNQLLSLGRPSFILLSSPAVSAAPLPHVPPVFEDLPVHSLPLQQLNLPVPEWSCTGAVLAGWRIVVVYHGLAVIHTRVRGPGLGYICCVKWQDTGTPHTKVPDHSHIHCGVLKRTIAKERTSY